MEISQKREIDKTILFLLTFFEYASQNTAAVSIAMQDYFAFNNFKSLEEKKSRGIFMEDNLEYWNSNNNEIQNMYIEIN